ncbi:uncharacterized protein PGRI_031380 [Penicillium griseofulvum]|uniref:Uncharacterized protein n=1 Tax=Penicillium patulum TaxID=5078 RepID=A0A135LK21_PENPA|nr:uncharacterized protein PGRI_031380 [Penicillium griseofulvum]KXG49268.1 hypothetical protein PGRI_031380 [Penicillium griseofulvum]
MSILNPYDHLSFLGRGGGLLSSDPAVYRRQVSRIQSYMRGDRFDAKKNRKLRNARYQQSLQRSRMGEEARRVLDANPKQIGGPRMFKILVTGHDTIAGRKLHDPSFYHDEGHYLFLPAFGTPDTPMRLNNGWIAPSDIQITPERNIYTVNTQDSNGDSLSLFIDFTNPNRPTGQIYLAGGNYAVMLQPYAVSFDVQVAANSGAYLSSGQGGLVWDPDSSEWNSASWETSMTFQYDTVSKSNPFGSPEYINEAAYTDRQTGETFSLDAEGMIQYTAVMDGSDPAGAVFSITITDQTQVPSPPEVRVNSDVKSVFPNRSVFKFDAFATSFTGAYIVPDTKTVYGVIGTAQSPFGEPIPAMPRNPSLPPFKSIIKPSPHLLRPADDKSSLNVTGLTSLNPMEPVPDSPTQYRDVVSQAANKDFSDIIAYHMDDDLRTTFVQATPIVLEDETVQAIATDSGDNSTFYNSLQVPYVTASLSRSTLPEAKECNALRAQAQLQSIPAESDTYKRHAEKLYRHRYLLKFPSIQAYLDDQAGGDHTANIKAAAEYMKNNIKEHANGMGDGGDPDQAAKNLQTALDDIDSLCSWAVDKKLLWAFQLYYWGVVTYLPSLMAQVASGGATSGTVSRMLKSLTGTFSILENGQSNPDGKSFQQAFNDVVQVYMMTSMIPQFIDANGVSENFDSVLKAMLEEFYEANKDSSNADLVEEANNAKLLAADDFIRKQLFNSLDMSMLLGGSLGDWSNVVKGFNRFNEKSDWFKKLANGAGISGTFLRMACSVLVILPLLSEFGGGWDSMTDQEKASIVTTLVELGVTFTIKGIQGAIRLNVFWEDLSGFSDCLKAFFGFESVMKRLPSAAQRTESELAQWLIRTPEETMEITGEAVSKSLKIFGRSAGEFLANVVGCLLAAVDLVLTALDLAGASDPLQIAMDSLMIASTAVQLFAIGLNWFVSGASFLAEGTVAILESVVTCAGPVAFAFLVAGLIVMIVMMFLHKDPPNPIQDFIDKHAKKLGLKMEHETDIDYFNVVPPDSSASSLNGISISTGSDFIYLALGKASKESSDGFVVDVSSKVTYAPDTCWCITTNSTGKTTIFTYALDSKGNWMAVCLGQTKNGDLEVVPPPSKITTDAEGNTVPVDDKVYQEALGRQQWTFICQSKPTTTTRKVDNTDTTYVTSATFQIMQGSKALMASDSTIHLGTTSDSFSTWKLSLETLGPAPFYYNQAEWTLSTDSRDELNWVHFKRPTSFPLKWSITPCLPSFLTLVESGDDAGTVKQVTATAPAILKPTVFTLLASIEIEGRSYQQEGTLTITVLDANNPPIGE